ncbi:MAG: helix-turn-helix domain-containing protein [Planctomycetota bacterium]
MSRAPALGARERILDAAIDLFSTKGFDAASVREIVSRAGVSKPTLYYYFRNKATLAQELLTATSAEFREAILESAHEDPDLAEAISRLIYESCRHASRHLKFVRFLFATLFGGTGRSFLRSLVGVLQQCRKESEDFVRCAAIRHGFSRTAAARLPEMVMDVIDVEIMRDVLGVGSAVTRRRARSLARFLVAGTQYLAEREGRS